MTPTAKPRPPLERGHVFVHLCLSHAWTLAVRETAGKLTVVPPRCRWGLAKTTRAAELLRAVRGAMRPPADRAGNRIAKGYG